MGISGWWPRARAVVGVGAVLAAAIGLAACDKDDAEDGDLAGEGAMAPGAALEGPLRRIQVIGPAGGVPQALQVRLTAPMFAAEQVGGPAGDALRWTLSPAVEVEAVVVGVDVIELRPKVSLRPGTEYQLTVTGLQRGAELLSPPEADAWSHSFRTPDFGLLRASPRRFSPKDGVMEVDLRFTGAVRAEDVLPKLELRGPGGGTIRFTGTLLADGRTVRLSSRDPGALVEGPLQVSLAAGVPYAEDDALRAPAASATITLSDAPPVEVLAVLVKEGLSGFYFEVVCKDPSAGEERWYWDRDSYESWYVHERCMPDADAIASAIQISPAVPFTVTPGPAGFRIMGEFSRGVYDLSLGGGLRTIDGGQLPADVTRQLEVPRRAPAVEFVSNGRYLPRSAWRNLAVRALNVDKVEVEVRHVPPENLVFWLSGDERADARTSVVLARTEVPIAMREDQPGTHYLDLASLVPNAGQGVYEVTVRSGAAVDAARLVLTDHQIIAKRGQSTVDAAGVRVPAPLWLWLRDVHTGGPSSGVELKAVRPSGQVLGRCLTGGDGHCALEFPADPLDGSEAFAIIAQKGADLTFLRFEDLLLQSDAETQGEPWSTGGEPVAYRAGLYTDRGVYRPGETVHLAGVVRDGEGGLPEALPRAVARFIDARGSELRRVALTPDANGHFTADLGLADFAATGRYHARLEVADRPVGELSFNVEEFVPERMAVSAKPSAPHVIGAERATFAVEGRWLFGGSASGSAVEASCRVEPARFRPPGGEGWHFGAASVEGLAHTSVRIGGDKGVLDAEGKASLRCAPASEAAMFGSAQVVAELAVMEGGSGRATRTTATVPVHPAPLYIGLRSPKTQVRRGQELTVEGRLVDLDGKDLSAGAPEKLEVEVFRLDEEVGWFWDEGEGSGQVRRSLRRVSEGRRVVPVSGGRFSLRWPGVSEAAGWLVVATGGGARTELFLEGDANRYAWWDGEQQADQTPRPARPTPMALTAPDQVEVGEDFEVTATAPYAGWVLWTVESDRVLTHRWEKVEAGPIRITPEVEEFTPNVYVSAFLIKDPHLESAEAFLPGRSYGARSVRVRPEAFEQPVKIEVAAEARPFAPLEVKLDLGRLSAPATATVAIVDEGVLQLTRFETPNPLHRVFARRQLGVESFETVGWTLMMEPGGPSSRTGGDGAGGSLGRVQLVKPVALWSGPVTVGVDGKATVKVDLPGYRGKLRVMAVASAGAKLGSAEASVVVRDPIVIQTTPPRVLATGDEVEVPVFVSNQTGKDVQVEVKLAAEALAGVQQVGVPDGAAPVRLLGADRTTLNLKVGQSDVAVFRLRSDAVRGAARLRVTASGGGEQSRDELDVPLVPARAEEHRTVSLALADMVDVDAALDAGGWIDGADRTQIIVTDNPYTASLGRITDLVRYPYGCIEQTVSSTRPLLALRALMPGLDADLVAEAPVDARVKAGIDRVLSMQTPSGGFAYWPGGADAHAWGTAYATHLLLDAKDARFDVPQVALDEALTYLERSGLSAGRPAHDSGAAYAHYVLARGGRARAGEAQRLLEQLPADGRGQVEEARTLLMAAVQLTGDRRHEAALRKPAVPAQLEARANDWTFYSELRRAGLLLNIVEDLFPGDKGSEALAQAVAEAIGRRDGRWYTTQELAWAVSGLGKRVSASGSKLPPVVLAADGKDLAATAAPTGPVWALNGASAVADLALRAPGAPAQARVLLRTHGVRSVPEVVESAGLRLERVALTASGGAADLRSQALGDRLFVKMSVENLRPVEVPNLAVVGRLPAGWEVESARVPVDPFAPEGQEALAAWSVDHVNVRDDRIELFGTLPGGQTRTVWLELRATSAGRFTWPGMTAEAMYDPNIWARLPSSQVEVRGPWTGSVL